MGFLSSLRYKFNLHQRKHPPEPRYYPRVVVSDVHLGMDNNSVDMFCEFLQYLRCDQLILNGDIIDGERINRRKPREFVAAQKQALAAIQQKIREGTELIYIPGNHDRKLRNFLEVLARNSPFKGVKFKKKIQLTDNKGRKMLVMHGDQFDTTLQAISNVKNFRKVWDHSYVMWLKASAALDRFSHKYLRTHFGLASKIKKAGAGAVGVFERFEKGAIDYARARGYDGMIIGHFHVDRKRELEDGFLLLNTGDWLESFTAVVMDEAGDWNHIKWAKERLRMGLPRLHFTKDSVQVDSTTRKALRYIKVMWPGRGQQKAITP